MSDLEESSSAEERNSLSHSTGDSKKVPHQYVFDWILFSWNYSGKRPWVGHTPIQLIVISGVFHYTGTHLITLIEALE